MVGFDEQQFLSVDIQKEFDEKITIGGIKQIHLDIGSSRKGCQVAAGIECEFTLQQR